MRPTLGLLLTLLCTLVAAQPATEAPAAAAGEAPRRAPAASDPADMQPAVDVSDVRPSPPRAAAPVSDASTPRRSPPAAMDSLDLGTTSITGNQELPKVLYIVPWKRSDLGDLLGRPVNTLLDEVLAPLDPDVFARQLRYYDTLYGDTLYGESQEE